MGPSGAGKTTLALRFIAQGLSQGERCLYVSFQENEDQLALKADSFGWEFNSARKDGRLTLCHLAPVELNLDRVSDLVLSELASGPTRRVVIDSLAELEFAASHTTRLPAYTWKLAKLIRSAGASLIITNEAASLGLPLAGSVSNHAFLFHNVLLLRYFELESEMRRALHVLKMRDSSHDKAALQFEVDEAGFHILQRLESVGGVLG
jgi:circadian clock protein KaiC